MKCPKCGKNVSTVYVEQEFKVVINGEMSKTRTVYDLDSGYVSLDEWLNNMLVESNKKPKVLGCLICL